MAGPGVRLGRAAWVGGGQSSLTAAWLRLGDAPAQAFTFTDRLREGAEQAVAGLGARASA